LFFVSRYSSFSFAFILRVLSQSLEIATRTVKRPAWTVFALSLAAFFSPVSADPPKTAARVQLDTVRDEVRAAHARGDGPAYLAGSQKMRLLLNDSPNGVLQVMSAQAFAGDNDGALSSFAEFIRMGQSNRQVFETKPFDALRTSARFLSLQTEMAKNENAIAVSSTVFRMPEMGMIPEDIDYDPSTRRFYLTSVNNHAVLACEIKGACNIFERAPEPWPMMALKVDSSHRTLWVTAIALHGFKSIPKPDWGKSLVLLYNLDSGKLLHRIPGPAGTTLGDMTLTPDGDAVVADNEGGLYRVDRKTLRFDRLDSGEFISPQTPAMCSDQHCVFVPDYVRGIAILDFNTRQVSWLPSDGLHALSGIDGLYLHGRTLIATQNGTSPERVVRFTLDPSLKRIESESIIERSTPTLGDPTHGVIVNGTFYYISNSGWDRLEDDGTPRSGTTPSSPLLMRADLPSDEN
jgi:hypothetical protein